MHVGKQFETRFTRHEASNQHSCLPEVVGRRGSLCARYLPKVRAPVRQLTSGFVRIMPPDVPGPADVKGIEVSRTY